jgi:hypothetical protein
VGVELHCAALPLLPHPLHPLLLARHPLARFAQQEQTDVRDVDCLLAEHAVDVAEREVLALQRSAYLCYLYVLAHPYQRIHDLLLVLLLLEFLLSLTLPLLLAPLAPLHDLHLRLAHCPLLSVLFEDFCYKSFH